MLAAIRRASTLEEVNIDTSHMTGNSHTDNNRCCSIDTETPTRRYEHNQTSRNDKTPVPSGLGGDGPSAFLRPIPLAQIERLYSGPLHSQAM